MLVNRKELLKTLQAVSAGLAKKENIEQSSTFVFTDNKVYTYNDEVTIVHPCELDIEGSVPAVDFMKLLNKLTTEEIDIETTDNEIRIKSKKAKAGLALEAEIKLPIDQLEEPEKWVKLPENFLDAVKSCLFAVGRDESKPVLMCLNVSNAFITACDNFRVTQYTLSESKAFKQPVLIPSSIAKDLLQFSPTRYSYSDEWLHFKKGDSIFRCRLYEDDFPDVEELLKIKGASVTLPDNMEDAIDRAQTILEEQRITIILSEDKIKVKSISSSGWFTETLKTEYNGPDLEFDIQPEFLKSILKKNRKAVIGDRMMKFKNEQFEHAILLMASESEQEDE